MTDYRFERLFTAPMLMAALYGCLVLPLSAQLTRGFISGVVQDSAGAVIGDVKITITNKATGIQNQTRTNAVGVYRFVAVEPGKYDVEFSQAGFETKKIANVEVTTTQEVTLNESLGVAASTTTIEVSDTPPGVDLNKSSASIERKLDQTFVANVAIAGATRDISSLALLAPTANRAPGSTTIAANGQRARNNNFLLDGVDNNDLSVTVTSDRVIPEAVAEFQTIVQAYSAEFGRNSGAQIQAITRSGSNVWHGEAWDYYRGNWMEPVNLLNKRAGLTKTPRFVLNQAGGDFGGHIIKNRTFFFSLIETDRRREAPDGRNSNAATIPTPAGFAALQNVPLVDSETPDARRRALAGLGFLNSVFPKVANFSNRRTTMVNNVPIEVGTINLPLANPYDFWYLHDRIDHRISDKDSITYRLQMDKRNQPDVISNLEFGSLFSGAQVILGQNHALSETHVFGSRFVNEFRFSYVRRNLDFPENDSKTPSTNITGSFDIGGLSNFPQGRIQNTFQWQNVSTFLIGRHSLKWGADIRRYRLFNIAAFDSKGTYRFDSLQDFINNAPASFTQAINTATFDARQTNQNYFFQDDFKATKNLTFNIGVRYETYDVPFGFFGATDPQSLSAGVPGPVKRDNNNWAPRLGLAYSPTGTSGIARMLFGEGQTVFRGGYGMAYDVLFYNILTVNASNFPRVVVNSLDRSGASNAWPNLFPAPPGLKPAFDPRAGWTNSPEATQSPTTHFYNFSIQREFARKFVFEVSYVGSRSYHGVRQGQLNPGILTAAQAATVRQTLNANSIPGLPGVSNGTPSRRLHPEWGARTTIETTALASYNAMYTRLDKRLSHGLTIGGNFTWSANLSDNDESLGVGDITNWSPQIPQDYFNYKNEWARSAFDVPYRWAIHFTYDVPWVSAPALNGPVMRRIFKGWSLNGFTDYQSGQPFTIRTGVDTAGTGTAGPHRPSYNPAGQIALDPVTHDWRTFTTPINGSGIVSTFLGSNGLPLATTQAFPLPSDNLGRNTFRGPALKFTNATIIKTIDITERLKAQLRCDFINAFNHRNFYNPTVTMASPVFGQNTLRDPGGRTMLLQLKIKF